jgi:hypothetical protein
MIEEFSLGFTFNNDFLRSPFYYFYWRPSIQYFENLNFETIRGGHLASMRTSIFIRLFVRKEGSWNPAYYCTVSPLLREHRMQTTTFKKHAHSSDKIDVWKHFIDHVVVF